MLKHDALQRSACGISILIYQQNQFAYEHLQKDSFEIQPPFGEAFFYPFFLCPFFGVTVMAFLWKQCKQMMQDEINLFDALKWMRDQKTPFRVEFVKTNLTLQTGGSVHVINHALVGANQKNTVEQHMIGFKDAENPENPPIHTYIYSICFVNGIKITI